MTTFTIIVLGLFWFLRFMAKRADLLFRVMTEIPFMKWMTMDDIVAMGFPRRQMRTLIPVLCEKNYFEKRPRADLNEKELEELESVVMVHGGNSHLYEFRRTMHLPRKSEKKSFSFPGFEPATA